MDINKAMGLDSIKLEVFNGTEYNAWKRKVQLGLLNLKVYHVLTDDKPVSSDGCAESEWEHADLHCKLYLLNSMSNSLAQFYSKMNSAKEIWVHLEQQYKDEERRSQTFLMERFFNWQFEDHKDLLPQVKDLEALALEIRQADIPVDDAWIVGAIVAKMPPSWKAVRAEMHRRKRRISLEDLRRYILVEDQQRSTSKRVLSDEELPLEDRLRINAVPSSGRAGPSKWTKKNKKKSGAPENLKVRQKNFKDNSKADKPEYTGRKLRCYNCGQVGHKAKECKVPKAKNNKSENVVNLVTDPSNFEA